MRERKRARERERGKEAGRKRERKGVRQAGRKGEREGGRKREGKLERGRKRGREREEGEREGEREGRGDVPFTTSLPATNQTTPCRPPHLFRAPLHLLAHSLPPLPRCPPITAMRPLPLSLSLPLPPPMERQQEVERTTHLPEGPLHLLWMQLPWRHLPSSHRCHWSPLPTQTAMASALRRLLLIGYHPRVMSSPMLTWQALIGCA